MKHCGAGPALVVIMMALAGCRHDIPADGRRADIRGRVTGVLPGSPGMLGKGIIGFVRVEGVREPDTGFDRAAITITDSTAIRLAQRDELHPAEFGRIATGDSVEAAFTGPILDSYPVQATASRITIIARR